MSDIKEKIAFIGLGQCGGNIAAVANKKGFMTGAINSSEEDLNSSAMSGVVKKLLIGETDGCGKDRVLAQSIVKEDYNEILEFVESNFITNTKIEIIYLVFSLGGGMGSGTGPIILTLLKNKFKNITFAAIVANPELDESSIAIFNTRKALEELYNIQCPLLLVDNNKKNIASRGKSYNSINNSVINAICEVIKERTKSSISNLDKRDALKLLKTNGVTVIAITTLVDKDLENESNFTKTIVDSWETSVFCPLEYDNVYTRVGFIYEIPEEASKYINYDNLIKKYFNVKKEIFEGIYPVDNSKENDKKTYKVISILTGLSYPETRVKQYDEIIKETHTAGNNKKSNSLLNNKGNVKQFEKLFETDNDEEDSNDTFDVDDIFKNF